MTDIELDLDGPSYHWTDEDSFTYSEYNPFRFTVIYYGGKLNESVVSRLQVLVDMQQRPVSRDIHDCIIRAFEVGGIQKHFNNLRLNDYFAIGYKAWWIADLVTEDSSDEPE